MTPPGSTDPRSESTDLRAWLEATRAWAEELLTRHLDLGRPAGHPWAVPPALAEVVAYALTGGGKRLRPALVRMVCEELGGPLSAAERPAVAVEMIHAYSLVHDDLPCMDDDALRRGRASCHVVYGEALALLAGDALQTAAFEVLAAGEPTVALEQVRVLARAVGPSGMVGGQVLDMVLEGAAPDLAAVRAMHARKTGALITAAVELGALAAAADAQARAGAARFGAALGALFQVIDDILDVTGDSGRLGKTAGKDAALDKPTVVRALGLEGARAEARERAAEALAEARALGLGPRAAALVHHFLERDR